MTIFGPVSIRGDVIGGAGFRSGTVYGQLGLGKVTIGGNLTGGSNTYAGSILSDVAHFVTSVTIGGSVKGGSAADAGAIECTILGSVDIRGDLLGAGGINSGTILTRTTMGDVTIGGSLVGASGFSGRIGFLGTPAHPQIGNVTIGGSVFGGSGQTLGGIYGAGVAGEKIGAIKIGGDWKAGFFTDAGLINVREVGSITLGGSLDGSFAAAQTTRWIGDKVGAITIGGNLVGGAAEDTGEIDYASAKSITIAGSILGGTADFAGTIRGNAEKVVIGHDIRGADITSGAPLYAGSISGGTFGSITLGGSLIASFDHSSGRRGLDGAIAGQCAGQPRHQGQHRRQLHDDREHPSAPLHQEHQRRGSRGIRPDRRVSARSPARESHRGQ